MTDYCVHTRPRVKAHSRGIWWLATAAIRLPVHGDGWKGSGFRDACNHRSPNRRCETCGH